MKLFNNRYRHLVILALGTYSFLNSAFLETFSYYGITQGKVVIWLCFVLITALVWEGNNLLEKLIVKGKIGPASDSPGTTERSLKRHPLLALFLASMPMSALAGWMVYYAAARTTGLTSEEFIPIQAKLSILFATRINLFLHCLNGINFFIVQSRQKELEAETLRASTAKARLQAVQSHVNPHFLFNNLNALSTLVMTKNEEANDFLESFSTVYRYVLQSQDKELVPLREEMNYIEPYLFLLQKRFGNGIQVQVNVDDNVQSYKIIPLAIQMLVENAVKHNIVSLYQPLHIRISATDHTLQVANNLQAKPPETASTQTGLKNIAERYKIITGRDINVQQTATEFVVEVPLV